MIYRCTLIFGFVIKEQNHTNKAKLISKINIIISKLIQLQLLEFKTVLETVLKKGHFLGDPVDFKQKNILKKK